MNTPRATIHRNPNAVRNLLVGLVAVAAAACLGGSARAQDEPFAPLTEAELAELVGPVALYPDDILGIVLPASTYPLQIVEAARFLDERASNPNAVPDDDWDDSVVALLNYPEVVDLMNDDLDWTWALGEAVLNDEAGVLDAVQRFRDRAYAAGNLRSDDRQIVTDSEGVIEIAPADPEVVYIPYYEPARVVVYQPVPIYRYYPIGYPLYYYPYPASYRFGAGFFWGVTSWFTLGWHSHHLHVHHHTHYDHPFYGRSYYRPYFYRSGVNVTVNINNYRDVWRPSRSRGARPYDGYRARSDARVTRSYDGRRYRYGDAGRIDSRRDGGRLVGGAQRDRSDTRDGVRTPRTTRDGVAGRGAAVSRDPGTVVDRRSDGRQSGARPPRDGAVRTAPNSSGSGARRIEGGRDARTAIVGRSQDRASGAPANGSTPARTGARPTPRADGQAGASTRTAPAPRANARVGATARSGSAPRATLRSEPRATLRPEPREARQSGARPSITGRAQAQVQRPAGASRDAGNLTNLGRAQASRPSATQPAPRSSTGTAALGRPRTTLAPGASARAPVQARPTNVRPPSRSQVTRNAPTRSPSTQSRPAPRAPSQPAARAPSAPRTAARAPSQPRNTGGSARSSSQPRASSAPRSGRGQAQGRSQPQGRGSGQSQRRAR